MADSIRMRVNGPRPRPNHHRGAHRYDAPFEFADMSCAFGDHRERVLLNEHLPEAA